MELLTPVYLTTGGAVVVILLQAVLESINATARVAGEVPTTVTLEIEEGGAVEIEKKFGAKEPKSILGANERPLVTATTSYANEAYVIIELLEPLTMTAHG